MQASPYSAPDAVAWDEIVARCPMATFLHTRRFLSYHQDRFQDISLLLKDERQHCLALFPAAVDPTEAKRVVSHPGITFGGLLHTGELYGEKMIEAMEAVKDHYAKQGFHTLRYKVVPHIYHQAPAQDDLYALFRAGANRYRCDLSCAINLDHRLQISERRKRGQKKAGKSGVEISEGTRFIQPLWSVLESNLARKFQLRPVHSIEEITSLHSLFPENIEFVVATLDSAVVAGIVLFVTPGVVHVQYTASSESGQKVSALDAVFEYSIKKARARGARYFDFGISTENDGQHLNTSLYQYKSEFGGGGVVHDFYELNLGV